ncbi:hypothetical protein BHYA_0085g00130 [Botrytis hyacinthi]|uniref:Heterokaryon incompatibility domain-containing protein n=1 Tax=Botrytis hyacinthi TaxID=278943 RepID=A0A4Z1GM34_9HELO|nr:hypothetical protein BHYA_0085g00130 [Botrytis hyacinthi]
MDAIQPTWLFDVVAGCLVPGHDAETLQAELNSMARIYTTSCITIVAADGIDANHGLRGFKGITAQRDFKQNVMSMTPPIKLIDHRNRIGKTNCVYHSRAWTHQEYLCAKRRLIFENGTVHWECSASTWSEELIPDIKPHKARKLDPLFPLKLFADTAFPDMKNMNYLLREFNRKDLTFPDGALAAFSGIQWGLSQIFEGGLLYGIPELFLEIGLMWNPIGFGERRYSTKKEVSQLPSWSFLGWQVGVSFTDDCEFEATSWKRAEYIKGVHKPVTTSEDITQAPLKGWMHTRFGWDCGDPAHLNTFAYSGDGQEYAYWHSNSPGRWYKYPVPVLDSKKQHPVQLQTQFLYCQTSRAFIHGVPDISTIAEKRSSSSSELKDNANFTNVKFQDSNGEVVGFLRLMCESDRAHFTQNATPGAVVELVAISQGWYGINAKSGEEKKEVKDWFPDHTTRQDCYHVLWVGWENGIAYRRGNGCVVKEVWEREREEELLDLVLG